MNNYCDSCGKDYGNQIGGCNECGARIKVVAMKTSDKLKEFVRLYFTVDGKVIHSAFELINEVESMEVELLEGLKDKEFKISTQSPQKLTAKALERITVDLRKRNESLKKENEEIKNINRRLSKAVDFYGRFLSKE